MPYTRHLSPSPKHLISRLQFWGLCCLLILICLDLTGCEGVTDSVSIIDQSSPEATVRTLFDAMQRGDVETYRAVIDPKDPHFDEMVDGFEKALATGYSVEAEDLEVQIVREEVETVRVRTYYSQKILFKGQTIDHTEQSGGLMNLVKRNGRWFVRAFGRDAWLDEPVPE